MWRSEPGDIWWVDTQRCLTVGSYLTIIDMKFKSRRMTCKASIFCVLYACDSVYILDKDIGTQEIVQTN